MKLITNPRAFDVVVTENMFGDILSDEASVITGSLGMLPSASIRTDGFGFTNRYMDQRQKSRANKANPVSDDLSVAMMLRYSFGLNSEAAAIEQAVMGVFEDGYCTADLATAGRRYCYPLRNFVTKVIEEIEREFRI